MRQHPASVESEVAFLKAGWRDRQDIPHIYSRQSRLENTERHHMTIHNARPRHAAGDLDLDDSGFILVEHESQVTDFRDKTQIADVYFAEMRDLILAQTGAAAAFSVQFYQVRSAEPAHFFDAYSLYMHCDFSPNGWTRLAQQFIRAAGADTGYSSEEWDFALYNLWRPVGGAVEQDPLVLIDASTLARSDIVEYSPIEDRDDGRAALPLFNPGQTLYYVPDMRPNEVLVFKQMDSRPGRALVCPHTSFHDPTARPDARARESIDIRISDLEQLVKNLSGGNQQKVVLSKWMATEARLPNSASAVRARFKKKPASNSSVMPIPPCI